MLIPGPTTDVGFILETTGVEAGVELLVGVRVIDSSVLMALGVKVAGNIAARSAVGTNVGKSGVPEQAVNQNKNNSKHPLNTVIGHDYNA